MATAGGGTMRVAAVQAGCAGVEASAFTALRKPCESLVSGINTLVLKEHIFCHSHVLVHVLM